MLLLPSKSLKSEAPRAFAGVLPVAAFVDCVNSASQSDGCVDANAVVVVVGLGGKAEKEAGVADIPLFAEMGLLIGVVMVVVCWDMGVHVSKVEVVDVVFVFCLDCWSSWAAIETYGDESDVGDGAVAVDASVPETFFSMLVRTSRICGGLKRRAFSLV